MLQFKRMKLQKKRRIKKARIKDFENEIDENILE